ncbi:MAG: DUF1836 domain-containing protein [Clostridia bacterium]|nr:DUF1836 domain-containing protein [Clostridia bacterium]
MNLQFFDDDIPGTHLKRADTENLTGLDFLKKVFFVSDGVMLTQIRRISGIDSSTLQNWTKRGWVTNARSKKYDIDQVAHILIINMLRSCMQLDHIAFLIHYINGDVEDTSDDIIRDSILYDYICRILMCINEQNGCALESVGTVVEKITTDYVEPVEGARIRLNRALEIIVVTYYSALMKHHATKLLEHLGA